MWQYFAEQDVAQTAALMRTVSSCDVDDMAERRRRIAQLESSIITPDTFESALGIRIPEGFVGLSREELEEQRYQDLMAKYRGGDFEDNIIVAVALRANPLLFVTSDQDLIQHAPLPAVSVSDALTFLQGLETA